MEHKFFICKHCGNIIGMIEDKGVPVVCCGEKMTELVANTSDGAMEKHVPVVEIEGNLVKVKVGEVPHPMTDVHHISWIYLETENGGQRKALHGDKAEAQFAVVNDTPRAVYEYCNLHGLWKKQL